MKRTIVLLGLLAMASVSAPARAADVEVVSSFEGNKGPGWKATFNVVDYGAKGDGVADDTPAIQKAINAAAATPGGGNVVFPEGIHWPTDASLLWDTWRVAARLLARAREIFAESVPHRFHTRKIKKLCLFITRYIISSAASRQAAVRASFRTLIERVEWIVGIAADFCARFSSSLDLALAGVALELQGHLAAMRTVVATARRANIQGETVPACERVFSIFEPHTELIQRGKRQKPVEFGHKLLLCETKEKFITDYEVYEEQQADCALTEPVIERHRELFGERPVVLAADSVGLGVFCHNLIVVAERKGG